MRRSTFINRSVVCLESDGYRYVPGLPTKQGVRFYRPTEHRDLWNVVELSFLTPTSDALATMCGVSVTRIILYKGLTQYRACLELATDPERGVADLDSAEQREDWHARLDSAVSPLCQQVSEEEGLQLLQATESARRLASSLVAELEKLQDWERAAAAHDTQFRHQTAAVDRIVAMPGVIQLLHSLDLYRIAAHLVLASNSGYAEAFEQQALSFHEISWPLQLIVDRLVATRLEAGGTLDFLEK